MTDEPAVHQRPSQSGTWWRVVVVAVVALGAFVIALSLFGDDAPAPAAAPSAAPTVGDAETPAAAAEEEQAPAYDVRLVSDPDPPAPTDTVFTILVNRDGQPVSGAEVRMNSDMTEMSHQGLGRLAEEVAPGEYQARFDFPMRGAWRGAITVAEDGRPPFSTSVSFAVQ